MRASARAAAIARLTLTKKAYDVAVLDLRGLTTMADFFVVCSADSENQIRAVADAVEEGMEEGGELPWHREAGSPNWVLLDYVDVVLHIFHREARTFYSLEKLWGDAVITAVADGEPAGDLARVLDEKAVREEEEGALEPAATGVAGKIRVPKGRAAVKKGKKSAGKPGAAKRKGGPGASGTKGAGRGVSGGRRQASPRGQKGSGGAR